MDNNKKIIFGVVGGAAILGIAYYMFFANKQESKAGEVADESSLSEEDKILVQKVKDLGPLKTDDDGHINFDYLCKFSKLVTIEAINRHRKETEKSKNERRELLKAGDHKKYTDLVLPVIASQNTIQDDMLALAGKVVGYFGEELMNEMDYHAKDMRKAQVLAQLMQQIQSMPPVSENELPADLTKEKVLEAFKLQLDELYEVQMKMLNLNNLDEAEQQKQAAFLTIEQGDKLFLKTGIEEADLNKAMRQFGLINDPNVQKLAMDNMMKLQTALSQMQAHPEATGEPGLMGGSAWGM